MQSGLATLCPMATAGARPWAAWRVAHVEVVVQEHGAADRRDGDRAVLDAQLLDGLGEELVGEAVAAARAVVGGGPSGPGRGRGGRSARRRDGHALPPWMGGARSAARSSAAGAAPAHATHVVDRGSGRSGLEAARRTSSSSWLMLASTMTICCTRCEQGRQGIDGEGPQGDGPEQARLDASGRSSRIAALAMRAGVLLASRGPRHRRTCTDLARCSAAVMPAYLRSSISLCFSRSVSTLKIEVLRLRRWAGVSLHGPGGQAGLHHGVRAAGPCR